MHPWHILQHSWRQVFGNFGSATQIVFPPFVLGALCNLSFQEGLRRAAHVGHSVAVPPSSALLYFLLFVIAQFVLATASVNWHRFILCNESCGWLPRINLRRSLRYFLRAFIIVAMLTLVGILLGVVVIVLLMLFEKIIGSDTAGLIAGGVSTVIILVWMVALFLRFSVALPGAALDTLGLRAALRATRGQGWLFVTLSVIAVLVVFLGAMFNSLVALLPGGAWDVGFVAQLGVDFVVTMLGLSLLTTLYGVFVENRELV